MAARKRLAQNDACREKIKTSQLINRLQGHILDGKKMEKTQITAALGLLKKTLPDLQSIDGTLDHNVFKHEQALKELD